MPTRERWYRDPVHDFITLREPLFLELVDTPEFQRLRRIRQLGASYGTYHGAEHSRFGHSLGVLWIMSMILERFAHLGVRLDEEWATVAKAAALLHDVGHGPFSHALERRLTPGADHEDWTRRILLEPTRVHQVLAKASPDLPAKVAAVISGEHQGPAFIRDLVSSQLDVDRMDYLLRDSLYTGVTYGTFDLQRLINTLLLDGDRVVSMAKGIVAIEEYLLARYFMYWQVYLHKTTRSQEVVLSRMWQRAVDLWREEKLPESEVPPTLVPFLGGEPTLEEYLAVDDHDLVYAAKLWTRSRDRILADLARRFVERRLLKPVYKVHHESVPRERLPEVEALLAREGWPPEYYLAVDDVSGAAYDLYRPDGPGPRKKPILVLDETGVPREITQLSPTMRALSSGPRVAVNVFVPEPVIERVRAILMD
ncbi:MAG: HD domain-containing protein [Clostridia bacterium]|nr:hypothetical protein [Bacillota bacterium]MBO2521637.1 hypothetical protein [Bacillota bacterium]